MELGIRSLRFSAEYRLSSSHRSRAETGEGTGFLLGVEGPFTTGETVEVTYGLKSLSLP